jgi:hypothetical protein
MNGMKKFFCLAATTCASVAIVSTAAFASGPLDTLSQDAN